jgi:hypothetical protein
MKPTDNQHEAEKSTYQKKNTLVKKRSFDESSASSTSMHSLTLPDDNASNSQLDMINPNDTTITSFLTSWMIGEGIIQPVDTTEFHSSEGSKAKRSRRDKSTSNESCTNSLISNNDQVAFSTYSHDASAQDGSVSSSRRQTNKPKSPRKIQLPPVVIEKTKKQLPIRNPDGTLFFADFPEFRPNLTPKEIIQLGSFGGCYFQPMASSVTGQSYNDAWKEFPSDWFQGLEIDKLVAAEAYDPTVNHYKVHCGGDLKSWEEAGWITDADPYGWFQWYCRFFLGRRSSDDHRQVSRAIGMMGVTGRWRKNLINKCLKSNKPIQEAVDDVSISPKVRQLLQVITFL